jgi:hypothetical protein
MKMNIQINRKITIEASENEFQQILAITAGFPLHFTTKRDFSLNDGGRIYTIELSERAYHEILALAIVYKNAVGETQVYKNLCDAGTTADINQAHYIIDTKMTKEVNEAI